MLSFRSYIFLSSVISVWFFYEWHDRYDFSITLSTCGTLCMTLQFKCALQPLWDRISVLLLLVCLRVQSLTFPRLLVLLRLPHPTNQVSCLSIKHFFQVSNADNCQVCRTLGRSCAGPQTMFDIFLKEVGTLFVGRHKTGPCEAAEDGVAIF